MPCTCTTPSTTFALYLAITTIGAIVVRINFRLHPTELEFVLRDSQSMLCITDVAVEHTETEDVPVPGCRFFLLGHHHPSATDWHRALQAAPTHAPDVPIPDGGDPAMLMYTSGTTGAFKGVEWTHDGTMWHAALQALHYGFSARTVAMTTGPLYHIGALENWLSACLFVHGHGVISPSRDFEVGATLDNVARHQVTDLFMFSFMFPEMLQRLEARDLDLQAIRTLMVGGAGIPDSAVSHVRRHLPRPRILLGYGMTETGTTTAGELADGMNVDFVGRTAPGYEIAVVDASGVEVDVDVEGEIVARGPSVASRYWERPDDSADVFTGGWCHSGDIGSVDAEGNLHLRGRLKDLVRTGGENVHPGEVESVLMSHPDVADVAVIGLPDALLTESVCALVVRRPESTVSGAELTDYVKQRIASYKKPRHVEFVDDLPRNASGKLLKTIFRERYAGLASSRSQPTPDRSAHGDDAAASNPE